MLLRTPKLQLQLLHLLLYKLQLLALLSQTLLPLLAEYGSLTTQSHSSAQCQGAIKPTNSRMGSNTIVFTAIAMLMAKGRRSTKNQRRRINLSDVTSVQHVGKSTRT
jgi:hypothetical protein